MSRAKNTANAKKIAFERKQVNGKPNPKYVDVLTEDKPIAGQHFACVSFISPEKILKQKNIFFFEEFLKKWDFNKSMEKFIQFLNFIAFIFKKILQNYFGFFGTNSRIKFAFEIGILRP